jgi:hypothetical protein
LQLGEFDYFFKFLTDDTETQSHEGGIVVYVVAGRQLGIETHSECQPQYPAFHHNGASRIRLDRPHDDFQQGGFSGTVPPYDTDEFAPTDNQVNVPKGGNCPHIALGAQVSHQLLQGLDGALSHSEGLAHPAEADCYVVGSIEHFVRLFCYNFSKA